MNYKFIKKKLNENKTNTNKHKKKGTKVWKTYKEKQAQKKQETRRASLRMMYT